MYHLTAHRTPLVFLDATLDFLLAHELGNNLTLGLTLAISDKSTPPPGAFFLSVSDKNGICATCISTIGRAILSSPAGDPACIEFIANHLQKNDIQLDGVFGETADAKSLVNWLGETREPDRGMLAHQLETISAVKLAEGSFSIATEAESEWIAQWRMEFQTEISAYPIRSLEELRHGTIYALQQENVFAWKNLDGEIVSMALLVRNTPNFGIIGGVYTPKQHRGHGYARSCVLKASEIILQRGKKYCGLFTDVQNPVSNHIYHQIGYRPVGTFSDYQFKTH